jgi:hypothetical protein
MRTTLFRLVALAGLLYATPLVAQTGSPNTTPTGVTRVTLIRITRDHGPEFWQDVRQHLKPIYEEYKRRGVITDYAFKTKVTSDNENDWNVALSVTYPNYAALDDLTKRTDPVTLAHYGSLEKRTAAGQERMKYGTVVHSYLLRDLSVNDWK